MTTTNTINANPTKDFFIDMLTRDIALDRAILDLIDNSVDAWRSNNKQKNSWIRIDLNSEQFCIHDNCGGISRDTAQNYAFRFGRPKDSPPTPHSVGQFGVGMKRTLFKLGNRFSVISNKSKDRFRIDVDVNEWKKIEGNEWTFNITELKDEELGDGETKITVNSLYPQISKQLSLDTFINCLSLDISSAHFKNINEGLKIYINSRQIDEYKISFLTSDSINIHYEEFDFNDVKIKILAGISDRNLNDAGWYIVCNGRLVVSAEQSSITGWQSNGIPKYHADYAFFRGIVEFDSEDSSKLPWTTTKTGIDKDSSVYITALGRMNLALKPIIAFLKQREKEESNFKGNLIQKKIINEAIKEAKAKNAYDICTEIPETKIVKFSGPAPSPLTVTNRLMTISYKVSQIDYEMVRESLDVMTQKEVGERTFIYYKKYECDKND
ncbi:hypothetical protein B6D19_02675 [Gilliamella apicola]|uniref:ATP-binding protein n=1 Tax=Gilliamella TaxID=1193503 RepID=UPI000A354D37|nr:MULTISPECIES: ATP-binding protein [Gilliamella]MBI0031143.1 ATP-binding protein [Gilliamella sp. B14384G15]MBI0058493.1 ATP-binding protein [Gilliamella sp. B14384G12]OTQ33200.1 hypothetical protein B6D19_02675 [Gilliamella apicola]OTQ47546.1 hypothetical protein B6D20_00365 [Gilliamella apicola]